MIRKFFIQDGAQFYIFESVAAANSPCIHDEIWSWSKRLMDYDIEGAKKARQCAVTEYATRGIELLPVPL